MASAQAPAANPPRRGAATLRRPLDRALIAGVCAGVAERLGLQPMVVRLMLVLAVAAGGVGVAIYAIAWALIPVDPDSRDLPRRQNAWREAGLVALGAIGLFVGLHMASVHIGAGLLPLILGLCGMALLWRLGPIAAALDDPVPASRLERLRAYMSRGGRILLARLLAGGLFVAYAAAALLHAVGVQHSLGRAIWAVAIVAIVLGLVVGPLVLRLGRSLTFERAARIREHERAEVAAHLHDSVLQTLALIQKRAGDPREVAGLARRQERELRDWLLARPADIHLDSLAGALELAAAEVEELHRMPIEVVTVGDAPLAGVDPVVRAAREAMTNAAKFAGSERVDLYAEVLPERIEVFVRDRGIGFDPQAVPADRSGLRDSIIARMERHGGRAEIRSRPGEGTEVELVMDRGARP